MRSSDAVLSQPAPPAWQRMSGLDASFLFAETPTTPLHVGSLSIFEGAPFFDERGVFRIDDVRHRIAERLSLFPRFRQKPRFLPLNLGRPLWVDDADFDIANHVNLMVLPSPGSRRQLEELCSHLQMRMLDRHHPLWELWFVGGLEDGNIALVEKVHHAMVDGVSGVEVAAALLDLEPQVAPGAIDEWVPARAPAGIDLLAEVARQGVSEPIAAVRSISHTLLTPRLLGEVIAGVPDLARAALTDQRAPVGLRESVTPTRALRSVSVPLATLKAAAHGAGATVNDVALAAVGGGVRSLMESRGGVEEDAALHVLVPVSLRPEHDRSLGNRVATMIVAVPIGADDVRERVGLVSEATARGKAHHQPAGSELLVEALGLLPSAALAAGSGLIHSQHLVDIVVTNIPGPNCPLYFMGARMLESIPIVPLGGNLSIGVAVLSYDGRLTFGIHADAEHCPDVDRFADGLRRELDVFVTGQLV